jgi:Protein kinase domain
MAWQQTRALHESPSAERALAATAYDADRPTSDSVKDARDSLVGQRIDHFRIIRLLGEGGMGAVYLAQDTSLERTVAIKVLRRELASDQRLVDRLILEAQAQARLQHPNVVTIYYIGSYRGTPYFAMEYVPGGTLADQVQRQGWLPWGEALEYVIQTARALAAAHAAGMVHRRASPRTSSRWPTLAWRPRRARAMASSWARPTTPRRSRSRAAAPPFRAMSMPWALPSMSC